MKRSLFVEKGWKDKIFFSLEFVVFLRILIFKTSRDREYRSREQEENAHFKRLDDNQRIKTPRYNFTRHKCISF